MKSSIGLLLALVTSVASVCLRADEARQIAESAVAQWNAAFAKGGLDDIVSLYTDNAMLVQPNGQVSRNSGEIRAFWRPLLRTGVYAMDIVDARSEQEDTIVATSTLSDVKTWSDSANPQVMKYRYGGVLYSVLKRQADGTWKAQVQKWTPRVEHTSVAVPRLHGLS